MKLSESQTELTILMPCLNEAETLAVCIGKAQKFIAENNIDGEVLIADNGSTDDSVALAQSLGARVVVAHQKGYGSALQAGINAANGRFVIMGDADDSYDFYPLMPFVEKLRTGYDLVMGNRFKGGIKKGAMPWIHRYFGNPVLSLTCRLFFHSPIGDFNSGLRGFDNEKIKSLDLSTPGMEFAPEMVVKATIAQYKITEVPIVLHPDGRNRSPHLNTWSDGWRQLVFLLIYSPKWLFFFPSLFFFFVSIAALLVLLPGTLNLTAFSLDIHTLTIAGSTTVLSWQLFLFALFIRLFSINQGLFPARKKHLRFLDAFSLERGIGVGIVIFLSGLSLLIILFSNWAHLNYGPLNDVSSTFRLLIPALTLISLGVQTVFASFFVRILNLKPKTQYQDEMAR